METINLLIFLLGFIFGNPDSEISAKKVTLTIYPESHEVEINHFGLFFINVENSKAKHELKTIINPHKREWRKEIAQSPVINFTFTTGQLGAKNQEEVNSNLTYNYFNAKELEVLGIYLSEGQFHLLDMPKLCLQSADGTLTDKHWVFSKDKAFTITLAPFENKITTEELQAFYKRYQAIKDEQVGNE